MEHESNVTVLNEDGTSVGNRTLNRENFTSTESMLSNKLDCKRPEKARFERIHDAIRRSFDHPKIIHWLCLILLTGSLWGAIYSIADDFVPGTQFFGIFALFILAYLAGEMTRIIRMPPLLGMLVTGLFLRNSGMIYINGTYGKAAAIIRQMALFIILTKAGLGLDPKSLKSLGLMITKLAFAPALIEATVNTILSHYLIGMPWIWGALLGSILAAVSPAVVIPCLFALQEKGYGVDKGIPTLVVAAASLDDIFSISAYGVMISVIYSSGSDLTMQMISGPIGLIIGIIYGILWGFVLNYIPYKDDKNVVLFRVLMLAGGGLMVIYGSDSLGYPGAGPLGCIIAPVVATLGWVQDGWRRENNPVTKVYTGIWIVFQPILFSLIGSEVDITVLEAGTISYGLIILFCALLARILVCVAVAFGGAFDWKEKIFVALAWFPKATVQAALGPIPLDKAREHGTEEESEYGKNILILSVLVILLTAPLGAVLITLLGPKLLQKSSDNETNRIGQKSSEVNDGIERSNTNIIMSFLEN